MISEDIMLAFHRTHDLKTFKQDSVKGKLKGKHWENSKKTY